jgi:hypothetical protein
MFFKRLYVTCKPLLTTSAESSMDFMPKSSLLFRVDDIFRNIAGRAIRTKCGVKATICSVGDFPATIGAFPPVTDIMTEKFFAVASVKAVTSFSPASVVVVNTFAVFSKMADMVVTVGANTAQETRPAISQVALKVAFK